MFETPPRADPFLDRAHNAVWESVAVLRRFAESERGYARTLRRNCGKEESAIQADNHAMRLEKFCDDAGNAGR